MPIPPFVVELRELVGPLELWLPGITAVVLRDGPDGREVLLTLRSDNGEWAPITGILDPGEEPAVGAAREALEEAGVVVSVDRVASVGASPRITHGNGDKGVYLDVTFLCSWVSGEAQVSDDENVDVRWWPLSDLPPMADWLVARIDAALADQVEARFVR
ncbi:NUDIX domain-containing protein [Nocardioides sp. MAH-18]|uniref:NUDIX domain-containing protein n=1 Tax=Nocardioides agri TaxID=2682843 RepID=A0A6L6XWI0_9ACTN|nr:MULTISPECIES: NUDIX domain-containing protein [unclassified Nocardioides]MBA2956220.1 NUDIX domain-containing protein [Nocardioides sp. CGMCC 1.13656]MVQ51063.1 NUDIX domain-containing protein [Nocardioides sp. MAH-18]